MSLLRRPHPGTRTRHAAFTLIELLVVVAIIALLISILVPTLAQAREQAKTTLCLANQKSLAAAFVQYANENRDAVVGSFTDNPQCWVDWPMSPTGVRLNEAVLRQQTTIDAELRGIQNGLLYRYILDFKVYHCPSDARYTRRPENGTIAYRTYSIPNYLNGDQGWETMIGGGKVAVRTASIRRASDSFSFIEESDPRGVNMNSWVFWLQQERWIDPVTVWHYDKSTIGFVDGHAIVKAWRDQRTIEMSRNQQFDLPATNNVDYRWLRARWRPD
ncbi:MAG: type II secretion system protein [Phycisphaerales bacterium]|nr:type II secretion system protein [Phycisphaerales bacterium]